MAPALPTHWTCETCSNSFLTKKYKIQRENIKTPLMVLLIIQNTHVKIPKYSQRQNFFLVLSEAKSVICLYLKIEKLDCPCWRKPKKCLFAREKMRNWKWNYYYNPQWNVSWVIVIFPYHFAFVTHTHTHTYSLNICKKLKKNICILNLYIIIHKITSNIIKIFFNLIWKVWYYYMTFKISLKLFYLKILKIK